MTIGVIGTGPLARRIALEIADHGRAPVTFEAAPSRDALATLRCLVLADDSDAQNVDMALHVRKENPSVQLVVRVFDPVLEDYLAKTNPDVAVLSMSSVAVPSLIDVVGEGPVSTTSLTGWLKTLTGKADRLLIAVLAAVLALAFCGTLFFAFAMRLSLVDAFYFVVTTITTTGYGDISPKDEPAFVKVAAALLMLFGTSSFAVLFALVSDWVFARRLDVVLGRLPTRWKNHVVLVGAGHMTARLAEALRNSGQHVLVVERDADNPLILALRANGHQVVVADATRDQTLRLAGVDRARAVLALTDQDAHNLHIALIARDLSAKAKVWARIDSPPLAEHVTAHASIGASSPLLLAAKAFAKEALARTKPVETS